VGNKRTRNPQYIDAKENKGGVKISSSPPGGFTDLLSGRCFLHLLYVISAENAKKWQP